MIKNYTFKRLKQNKIFIIQDDKEIRFNILKYEKVDIFVKDKYI